MAHVRKLNRSKYWYACYDIYGADGRLIKRKEVSTRLEDRSEALKVAISLEQVSKRMAKGSLSRRNVMRHVDEICRIAGGGALLSGMSTRAFLEQRMKSKAKIVKPRTARGFDAIMRDLEQLWGDRLDEPIGAIDRVDVIEWRDWMLDQGNAPTTVNARLSTLGSFFKEAVVDGYAATNPFEGTIIKGAKTAAQKRKPFTLDQVNALLDVLAEEPEWQAFIATAAFAGQRQQEVAKLKQGSVDLENSTILFQNSKAKSVKNKWVLVPIHPRLVDYLRPFCRGSDQSHVFPNIARIETRGRKGISSHFRENILPRIGIVQPYAERNAKTRSRKVAEYSFHSLRHFYLTMLDNMGVTEAQRMQLVGQADRNVTLGYTHPEFAKLREIADRLPLK